MIIEKGQINSDTSRDLFWARIRFSLPTGEKSQVLTCTSEEYLQTAFTLDRASDISEKTKDDWLNLVIEKWSVFGNEIFQQDIHYDVYMDGRENEAVGLAFLIDTLN